MIKESRKGYRKGRWANVVLPPSVCPMLTREAFKALIAHPRVSESSLLQDSAVVDDLEQWTSLLRCPIANPRNLLLEPLNI